MVNAAQPDPSFNYMQKSLTTMETGKQKAVAPQPTQMTEEARKGINSELRVNKQETEGTKAGYSTLCTSVNGTRLEQRKSIERMGSNGVGSQDYGSMTSGSPMKGAGSLAAHQAMMGLDVNKF